MDRKIKVTLWKSSWAKLIACIKSKDTSIDKDGDWNYVYEMDEGTGMVKKNKRGNPIKLKDPDTGKPKRDKADYDPSIKFDEIVKEIIRQIKWHRDEC